MRVLWISPNGGNYTDSKNKGTGGWVGAMETAVTQMHPELELGICFLNNKGKPTFNKKRGNVTYLPIEIDYSNNVLKKIAFRYFRNTKDFHETNAQLIAQQVAKYKPDIIHVWGIENFYSRAIKYIKDVPIVVHIQGLASNILYKYFSGGYSVLDAGKVDGWFNRVLLKRGYVYEYNNFIERRSNEQEIASLVKNWIGRTQWDYSMTKILSPDSEYFHCDELMRSDFDGVQWTYHYDKNKVIISSTISECWYKGFDIILRTAKVLFDAGVHVVWNVFGISEKSKMAKYMWNKEGITPSDYGIILHGHVNADAIMKKLLSSDMYVHPSYLENSSNSIAEAMKIGMPVIANNIGGNASMLRDDSGILVPANEPYALATAIMSLRDKTTATEYSSRALAIAHERQNNNKVVTDLLAIYNEILNRK